MGARKKGAAKFFHKYKINLDWSEEDQCFIASVPELPNLLTHGSTASEAVAMTDEAIEVYIDALKAQGKPIPEPMAEKKFSGKLPLRISPSLHRRVAVLANAKGFKSINKFIESILEKESQLDD